MADNEPPSIKSLKVSSRPTNENDLNGETVVDVEFYLKDSGSGIASLYFRLRDPFGSTFIVYPSWRNDKEWQRIHHLYVLPRGSVPGIWHLEGIHAEDNAGNILDAKLTEVVQVGKE